MEIPTADLVNRIKLFFPGLVRDRNVIQQVSDSLGVWIEEYPERGFVQTFRLNSSRTNSLSDLPKLLDSIQDLFTPERPPIQSLINRAKQTREEFKFNEWQFIVHSEDNAISIRFQHISKPHSNVRTSDGPITSAQLTPNLNEEIISVINGISATIPRGSGNRKWTAAVKRSFIKLGRARGYNVCTSGFPGECDPAWLFDLVWYRNEPQEHLREIGLVLESEWKTAAFQIKYDFEKLLIAKSPLKVMVFQDYKNNLPELRQMLETGIRTFHPQPAGEKYIFAVYENAKGAFSTWTIET